LKLTRTNISDIVLIEPQIFGDERGYFVETFRQDLLEAFLGFSVSFCQDNESKSNFGVLRGLHYQEEPFPQAKLVRVVKGKVRDVAVDIRPHSPTFGLHVSTILSEENKHQLFIPKGFAHGFVVLEDETIFSYKVDAYYSAMHDRGIYYNDPSLKIDWGIAKEHLKLSSKDQNQPSFKEVFR
jgi:dTDP-4-dehydrorhamnose 3,5-epimerase